MVALFSCQLPFGFTIIHTSFRQCLYSTVTFDLVKRICFASFHAISSTERPHSHPVPGTVWAKITPNSNLAPLFSITGRPGNPWSPRINAHYLKLCGALTFLAVFKLVIDVHAWLVQPGSPLVHGCTGSGTATQAALCGMS
jgi:hypothetical protein